MSKDEMLEANALGTLEPIKGRCFNAGVVVYNIIKLRTDGYTTRDFLSPLSIQGVYYDQGVLNYLFWDHTQYVDARIFNNRGWDKTFNINESLILHYAPGNPWELRLTEKDLASIENLAVLNEKKDYYLNPYYMKMIDVWWKYAKKTRMYQTLLNESQLLHDYFMSRIVKTFFESFNVRYEKMRMSELMLKAHNDNSFGDSVRNNGIKRCAIYGMGYYGKMMLALLRKHQVDVEYYVDQNNCDVDLNRRGIGDVDSSIPIIICVSRETDNRGRDEKERHPSVHISWQCRPSINGESYWQCNS